MKLKVGDKLRVLINQPLAAKVRSGEIITVIKVYNTNFNFKAENGETWNGSLNNFHHFYEMYDNSPKSTNEDKLKNAIQGLKDLQDLASQGILRSKQYDMALLANSGMMSHVKRLIEAELYIKESPSFKYATVDQGYQVYLENDKLKIGCETFTLTQMKNILKYFLVEEVYELDVTPKKYVATKRGIIDVNKPTQYLTWKEAEELHNKIKDLK